MSLFFLENELNNIFINIYDCIFSVVYLLSTESNMRIYIYIYIYREREREREGERERERLRNEMIR